MKFLKILLVIIAILVIGFFVYAGMSPKTMGAERSQVMNASPEAIYEEIVDFNKWSAWSPWAKMDPNMKVTVEGSGLNSTMSWTSENNQVGSGSQKIVGLEENKMVRSELDFGDEGKGYASFTLEPMGDSTKVTWIMEEQELGMVDAGFMNLFGVQDMINKSYEDGLNSLQAVAEAKPKAPKVDVIIEDKEAVNFISKTVNCTMEEIQGGTIHAQAYGEIGAFMAENNIEYAGMPMTIVQKFDGDENAANMTLQFAIPVAEIPEDIPEGLEGGTNEAGKTAYCIHYGSYESIASSWNAISKYVEDNKLEVRGFPYEHYLNDPETVQSEDEIQTAIVFPIN